MTHALCPTGAPLSSPVDGGPHPSRPPWDMTYSKFVNSSSARRLHGDLRVGYQHPVFAGCDESYSAERELRKHEVRILSPAAK